MSDRVLSSATAKSAIQQMSSIINGGLTDQINQLDTITDDVIEAAASILVIGN